MVMDKPNNFSSCLFIISLPTQLKGTIDDCSCNMDTVDHFNNAKIYPRMQSLLRNNYFRFYKANLKQPCPFWADDSKCAMKFCSVQSCEEKDVPEGIKGAAATESPYYKVRHSVIFRANPQSLIPQFHSSTLKRPKAEKWTLITHSSLRGVTSTSRRTIYSKWSWATSI